MIGEFQELLMYVMLKSIYKKELKFGGVLSQTGYTIMHSFINVQRGILVPNMNAITDLK